MAFNKAGDTINSREGSVVMTVDGKNITLAELQEASAQLEGNVEEINLLGKRMKGHKLTSAEGTGSISKYTVRSDFAKIMADWVQGGTYPSISLMLTVEDETSNTGKQVVQLMDVIFADGVFANLNSDDGLLEDETDFTFDDFKIIKQFS